MGALDPRTLIIVTAVTLLVTSTAVVLGGLVNRHTHGVPRLVLGYLLMAAGVGLIASQGYLAPLYSIYTANLMILGGLYVAWMGVRQLQQKPTLGSRYCTAGLVAIAVLFALLGLGEDHYWWRVLVFHSIAGGLSLLMARELLVVEKHNITDVYTGILFVLLGVTLWARAGVAAYSVLNGGLMVVHSHTILTYLAVMVLNLLLAFGYIMMMTERLEQHLRALADTDYLTGMNCRRAYIEQVERVLERARIDRDTVSMILLDIDDFKKINDTYGHAAGDEVLRDFAGNMSAFFRVTDILGRIGGEEFGVVLPHVDRQQAGEIAERLRMVFEASLVNIKGHIIQARVSIGVACTKDGDASFEALYHLADGALYEAKKAGKNCVRIAQEPGA